MEKNILDIQIETDLKDLEDDVEAGMYAYPEMVDLYLDRAERILEKMKQTYGED